MTTMRFLLHSAAVIALLLPAVASAKLTTAQSCEIAKEKAAAKKYSCLNAEHAKHSESDRRSCFALQKPSHQISIRALATSSRSP